MKAYIPLLIAPALLVGCAGTLNQRTAQSCPASIPAPVLQVGDTWQWQDGKGANWTRRYVRQTDDGLFEMESRADRPKQFYDQTHTLRKVYRDGQWVTDESVDFPLLGKLALDFPLSPGKSWSFIVNGRSSVGELMGDLQRRGM